MRSVPTQIKSNIDKIDSDMIWIYAASQSQDKGKLNWSFKIWMLIDMAGIVYCMYTRSEAELG